MLKELEMILYAFTEFLSSLWLAAWPLSLVSYVVSPGELDIEPRCGLWDIDNALLMILEINSFSVIL